MKIVSWNCQGAIQSKIKILMQEKADVFVIQEFEDLRWLLANEYKEYGLNYISHGKKGLAIIAKPEIVIQENTWISDSFEYFLSCKINNTFDLLGVWSHPKKNGVNDYAQEVIDYLERNRSFFKPNMIIMGDFNSNAIWNSRNRFDRIIKLLNEVELVSAYHKKYSEQYGGELLKTRFAPDGKGYHIDYCFINRSLEFDFKILSQDVYGRYSDHLPIMIEL